MANLPKDYVILGHIKDINVPKSWANLGHEDILTGYAWRYDKPEKYYDDTSWHEVKDKGWCHKSSDLIIAALPNSPLYNMNKKKTRPTVKQVKELNNKILDLETDKVFLEEENKKLREQLAAIARIISG